jgi:hypothetical protein
MPAPPATIIPFGRGCMRLMKDGRVHDCCPLGAALAELTPYITPYITPYMETGRRHTVYPIRRQCDDRTPGGVAPCDTPRKARHPVARRAEKEPIDSPRKPHSRGLDSLVTIVAPSGRSEPFSQGSGGRIRACRHSQGLLWCPDLIVARRVDKNSGPENDAPALRQGCRPTLRPTDGGPPRGHSSAHREKFTP